MKTWLLPNFIFFLTIFLIHTGCKNTLGEEYKESFSPDSILKSCWTSMQLEGHPSEKAIRKDFENTTYYLDNPSKELKKPDKFPQESGRSIRRVKLPKNKKIIALTFDLCESKNEVTGYDNEIVNYLRKKNIKATFFASGKWMQSHVERTMQLMSDPLFEIGNHAWTHRNFSVIKETEMEHQIIWTQLVYNDIRGKLAKKLPDCGLPENLINNIPENINLFRFPFGTCNASALKKISDFNLSAIQWDVVSSDPLKSRTALEIAERVIKNTKPGSIIVMHANGKGYNTSKALEFIIPDLMKKGYSFATVNEILNSAEKIESSDTCFELKPGDNLIYNK